MLRMLPSKSGPPDGAVQEHVERIFGPVQQVIPVDTDLQILVAEDPRSGCLRLVTQGMSGRPMLSDKASEVYAELMLTLVPGTPTEWPLAVLTALAQYPFENNTFLYAGHTVENQGLPECPYPFFLLGPSVSAPEEFTMPTLGTTPTLFLSIYPVYGEEVQLRKEQGIVALQKRFERYQINDFVQEARLNCCGPIISFCEGSLESARKAMRAKKPEEASRHLLEAGQAFEELSLSGQARVMYQLAGEAGARAAERLKAFGARLDPVYLEGTERRLMGLDFPPMTPKQLKFGLRVVKKMHDKFSKLFTILLDTPRAEWSTRLGDFPEAVMSEFMDWVQPQRQRWIELACGASLWCFLDATRDHHDYAESAYRAVLSQGDERSDLFMDLDDMPRQLEGIEDLTLGLIGGDDAATRTAAAAALYLWSSLDSEASKNWLQMAERTSVAVTTNFLQLATRLVGPRILEGFSKPR